MMTVPLCGVTHNKVVDKMYICIFFIMKKIILIGSQWKDLPTTGLMGRNGAPASTFNLTQTRLKSEPMGNGRNGAWDEIGNQSVGWDDQNVWTKPKVPNHMWENEQDWNQKSSKLHLTKDVIWNSKQFRMLVDMGHKVL